MTNYRNSKSSTSNAKNSNCRKTNARGNFRSTTDDARKQSAR